MFGQQGFQTERRALASTQGSAHSEVGFGLVDGGMGVGFGLTRRSDIFGQTLMNTVTKGSALAATQGLRLFWAIGGDFNCSLVEANEGIKNVPKIANNFSLAHNHYHQRRDFIVMCGLGCEQVDLDPHVF